MVPRCKLMQEFILKTKKRCRPDNRCFGKDTSDYFFCSTLSICALAFSSFERSTTCNTLVRKNSDEELVLALCDETWMKRSTSYLATASAIRSAPSTWTSSNVKFLLAFITRSAVVLVNQHTWWDSLDRSD